MNLSEIIIPLRTVSWTKLIKASHKKDIVDFIYLSIDCNVDHIVSDSSLKDVILRSQIHSFIKAVVYRKCYLILKRMFNIQCNKFRY